MPGGTAADATADRPNCSDSSTELLDVDRQIGMNRYRVILAGQIMQVHVVFPDSPADSPDHVPPFALDDLTGVEYACLVRSILFRMGVGVTSAGAHLI